MNSAYPYLAILFLLLPPYRTTVAIIISKKRAVFGGKGFKPFNKGFIVKKSSPEAIKMAPVVEMAKTIIKVDRFALRKAKIIYNVGLFECNRVELG